MLNLLAGIIIDSGLQAVGWAVMKGNHARSFQPEDVLFEATLGFVTLSLAGYGVYRWLF
jgi:hypothetical protein